MSGFKHAFENVDFDERLRRANEFIETHEWDASRMDGDDDERNAYFTDILSLIDASRIVCDTSSSILTPRDEDNIAKADRALKECMDRLGDSRSVPYASFGPGLTGAKCADDLRRMVVNAGRTGISADSFFANDRHTKVLLERQPISIMPKYRAAQGMPWTEADQSLLASRIGEKIANINEFYSQERNAIAGREYEEAQEARTAALYEVFDQVLSARQTVWPERGIVPILKPDEMVEYASGEKKLSSVFDRCGVADEYAQWVEETASVPEGELFSDRRPVISEYGPNKGFFKNEGKMRFDAIRYINEHDVDMDRMHDPSMYLEVFGMGEALRVLRNAPDNISHRGKQDDKDFNYTRCMTKAANALRSTAVIIDPSLASFDAKRPYEIEIQKMRSFNEPTLDEYEGIVLGQGRAISRMLGGSEAVERFDERSAEMQMHDLFEHQLPKNMPAYRAAQQGQWSQMDANLFEKRTRETIDSFDKSSAIGDPHGKSYEDSLLEIYSDTYQAECTDWRERGMFADIVNQTLAEHLGDGYADYKQWCADVERTMGIVDESQEYTYSTDAPEMGRKLAKEALERRLAASASEISSTCESDVEKEL